jgi:hypothetical protein
VSEYPRVSRYRSASPHEPLYYFRGDVPETADEIMRKVIDDYDRRRSKLWGRFLLWLLRKTT